MIIINLVFAVLTYLLAQRKGREALYWATAGGITPLFTILGLAFFRNLSEPQIEEDVEKSLKREKVFLLVMMLVGILNIIGIYVYRSTD